MAEQRTGRAIAPGQSVFHDARFFVAGDEDDLHAATLPASEIARLTRAGVISGFGATGVDAASLASDPTIQAGEEDAVLEDDAGAGGEMSETVHSEATRKAGAKRRAR